MVQVNVRVEPTLYAAIKRQARKDSQTVTEVVNEALRRHLQTEGSTTK